ncbi:MAG: hypothetical protein GY857_19195 [Desulfobacula sp.]|nr:hypothetical protein [Desulfobacula sp.]
MAAAKKKGNDLRKMFYETSSSLYNRNTNEIIANISSMSLIGTKPSHVFSDIFMGAFKAGDHLGAYIESFR